MKNKYITIKDIAQKAGVSINTVSRAMNNKPDIKKETKEKIEQIASELGYVKNFNASFLRAKKSKIIGVVTPDSTNPFFSEIFKSIETQARRNGYQVIIMNSEGIVENEIQAVSTLVERRVDGILMFPIQQKTDCINNIVKEKIPVVIVGIKMEHWNVNEIYNNEIKGGFLATEHLIKTKCKNIYMITEQTFNTTSKFRIEGFKKALKEYNIEIENNIIFSNHIKEGHHVEEGYKNTLKLINKNKVDGIFCYNDLMAFGVIKALKENGYKIPEDISVIGYDDINFSSLIDPALTTIHVHKQEMGIEAFNILKNKLNNKYKELVEKVLDVKLIIRNSTKKEI